MECIRAYKALKQHLTSALAYSSLFLHFSFTVYLLMDSLVQLYAGLHYPLF